MIRSLCRFLFVFSGYGYYLVDNIGIISTISWEYFIKTELLGRNEKNSSFPIYAMQPREISISIVWMQKWSFLTVNHLPRMLFNMENIIYWQMKTHIRYVFTQIEITGKIHIVECIISEIVYNFHAWASITITVSKKLSM